MPRRMQWIDRLIDFDIAASALNVQTLFSPDEESRGETFSTLTRMIVGLTVSPVLLTAVNTTLTRVSIGIGVASQDAITVGITALPAVNNPSEFPVTGWLLRTSGTIGYRGLSTGTNWSTWRIDEDVHGQRKLSEASLFMSLAFDILESGGLAMNVSGFVRMLMKIP